MVYKKGSRGNQVITERGLEKHLKESDVLIAFFDESGKATSLPESKGYLSKIVSKGESRIHFIPGKVRRSHESFSLEKGRTSVGFLVKYPSTCNQSEGEVFYRFYDFE